MVRGRKIGFVFQSYQLIPTLTAEENVLLPHELTGGNGIDGPKRARELLESVGLRDRRDHYPVQLSGGEQQRVALARAFMVRPPILLADEPTGNLDTQNGQHVLELLISLNQREGTTLVLVTHDPALSSRARGGSRCATAELSATSGRRRKIIVNFSWTTACKIAWRETRSSLVKFLFVVLAVAAGVGSLTGVRGFSRAFHDMLLSEARTLMAADLSCAPSNCRRRSRPPRWMRWPAGVERTWITETVTMASSGRCEAARAGVDQGRGSEEISVLRRDSVSIRPRRYRRRLNADTVAVSEDLLLRLDLKVGDTIRLGGQPFRIVGEVTYEPDRMLGSLNVGPRVMMSREAWTARA